MLYKSKSNQSLLKSKDFSLLHLTTLSNFLESEQGVTQDITKEIKNEINLSKKNERIIDKSMNTINTRAQELVRRFEEEKEKNEKLQFLVKHIEEEIYSAKLDKSLDIKNNADTDRLQELSSLLKARERDLEKICQKTNSSSYELSKKLDTIRALRSERTIVSELLDKIERELCNLEHCYKVLVIERTIEDHHCQEKLEEFRRLELSANKEIGRALSVAHKQRQSKQLEAIRLPNPAPNRSSFDALPPDPSQLNPRLNTQQEISKSEKQKEKKAKIENDIFRLQREKIVKTVLNNLGINSPKELPQSTQALSKENDRTLACLSTLEQQIQGISTAIARLGRQKARRGRKGGCNRKVSQDRRQELKSVMEEIRRNRLESSQFKQIAKILYQSIRDDQIQESFYNDEEELRYYMGFLQEFFERSYVENKTKHSHKVGGNSKRLTSLLNSHQFERNQMSIYEEQDLLDFAKKNLERMDKSCSRSQKSP